MNKTELIKLLSENTGFTQAQVKKLVDELVLLAQLRLKDGKTFAIHDLVKIEVVDRPARSGESMGVKWSKPAGKALKAKVVGAAKRWLS